jgi:hypothetical protein
VVTVLNHVYETDFLGFSYGFRRTRRCGQRSFIGEMKSG